MKACPICGRPIKTEGTVGCFDKGTMPSMRELAECYQRGYYREKYRADGLAALLKKVKTRLRRMNKLFS